MEKRNLWNPIVLILLGTAIYFSGYWTGISFENDSKDFRKSHVSAWTNSAWTSSAWTNRQQKTGLMTDKETSDYLGLSPETFTQMVKQQELDKLKLSTYPTYKYLPFLSIDGQRYFNRDIVDKWIEYNMLNQNGDLIQRQ